MLLDPPGFVGLPCPGPCDCGRISEGCNNADVIPEVAVLMKDKGDDAF